MPSTAFLRPITRLATRTLVILAVAGLVVAGATAVGYSPLGASLPGAFLRFGQQQREAPPQGVTVSTTGNPATGANVRARGPQGAPPEGQTAQGLFSGRNAPNVLSGLRQEVPYVALFAILTALVALALRILQPRQKRPTKLRLAASSLGG